MSENGDGLHGRIIKEEEESMREAIDKKMFANQSSSFMNPDDELLSWLQYPIDDDMFHHLPPPLTASPVAPAPADCFSSPSSFPLSTLSLSFLSSSSLSASPFAVKHLPQLENDAFTVAKNLSRRGVVDDWILHKEDLENENLPGEHTIASKNKGALVSLEGSFGMRNHYEAYRLENRGDKRAEMWANRVLDSKQGFVKDSRILAHLKPTVMEEREAQVAPSKSVPHSKHSALQRATPSHEDEHTNMMLTADSSQIEEGRGMQRRAEAQEEDLLQFQQASNEGYWLEDNVDMQLDTEERVPTIGRLQALSNADAALALGAGRAAGIIKPPGMEAFSKVRTSLQPTQIVPLGSPSISSRFSLSNVRSSLQPTQRVLSGSSALSSSFPTSIPFSGETLLGPASSNWMSTTLRPVGPFESIPVSQLSYQTGETKLLDQARLLIPRPSAGFSDMGSKEDQFSLSKKINTIRSDVTKTFSLEPPPRVALLSPRDIRTPTDGTNSVLLREETMAGVSGGTVTSDLETTDMQKLSSASFLSQEITAGTCSGGSQTSGSLKEALSGLKRKLEDSECLSEEADEDSVVSSQARTSNSKRPRANEVHNLSERRRRNRINDKMNALRELIPHASKSNKAALLDEAIDYLKNLQLQLQVMSLRTGVSLLPVVLPPSMPHMPIPDCRPRGSMGMDLSGGSALANAVPTMGIAMNKAYTVPARPFGPMGSVSGSLISTDLKPLQPLEANHSFSQLQGLSAHSHVQASSQSNFPISLNMCNSPHRDQYQQQQPQKQL